MFGIPGEVFWPTVAFGAIILFVFGGIALLRLVPRPKSRVIEQPGPEVLGDLQARLGQLDQLQQRVSELEERVDFAERIFTKQREGKQLGPSPD
jgi:hypothetical protein